MVMAVFELIQEIPLFLFLTFLVSYVVWSKFLAGGKLKPKDVTDLLEFCGVLLIFFVIFACSAIILNAFFSLTNLTFSLGTKDTEIGIIFLGLYGLCLLIYYGKKSVNKKDLQRLLTYTKKVFCFASLFFLAFFIALYFSQLRVILLPRVFSTLCVSVIPLLFIIYFGDMSLFKRNEKIPTITKKDYFILLGGIILIFIFVLFASPKISFEDSIVGYTLPSDQLNLDIASMNIERNFNIDKLGYFGLIPLYYGDILDGTSIKKDFSFTNLHYLSDEKNYSLSLTNERAKDYGILDYMFDNASKLIFIKFDRKLLREKNVFMFKINGERRVNISKDFIVDATTNVECPAGRECLINLTFINNLNNIVHGGGIPLLERPLFTNRNCNLTFVGGSIKIEDKEYKIYFDQSGDFYDIYPGEGFSLRISKRHPTNLRYLHIEGFRIVGHSKVNLTFKLLCD